MENKEPQVGPHWRIPWRTDEPNIIKIHCKFDQLKGTFRVNSSDTARGEEKYNLAKYNNDHEAAADLVEELINKTIVDEMVDHVLEIGKPVNVIFPHPEFDSDSPKIDHVKITNALPFALAAYISAELGGNIETNIVECARPGRTKLNRFQRFIWQARFTGEIDPSVAYIIVDDNCTLGGTLAMLRTHIVGNGGTVAYVCALSAPKGVEQQFSVADSTLDVLISKYSSQISPIWIKEIGHDITCLTEGEGYFLADWSTQWEDDRASLLQRLRDRLTKAKAKGK